MKRTAPSPPLSTGSTHTQVDTIGIFNFARDNFHYFHISIPICKICTWKFLIFRLSLLFHGAPVSDGTASVPLTTGANSPLLAEIPSLVICQKLPVEKQAANAKTQAQRLYSQLNEVQQVTL